MGKSQHQPCGNRVIRAENGAHETAAAAACEGDGILERGVGHERAYRTEGLHGMDCRGARGITAIQQRRAHEGAAIGIRAHQRRLATLPHQNFRFALEASNLLEHLAALAEGCHRAHAHVLQARIADYDLAKRCAQGSVTSSMRAAGTIAFLMAVHFCPALTDISRATSRTKKVQLRGSRAGIRT